MCVCTRLLLLLLLLFLNPLHLPQGREDGLEMVHWVKGYKDANGRIRDAQEGDYPFAKYNKKVRGGACAGSGGGGNWGPVSE